MRFARFYSGLRILYERIEIVEETKMKRMRSRALSLMLAMTLAFGFMVAMPQMAYAADIYLTIDVTEGGVAVQKTIVNPAHNESDIGWMWSHPAALGEPYILTLYDNYPGGHIGITAAGGDGPFRIIYEGDVSVSSSGESTIGLQSLEPLEIVAATPDSVLTLTASGITTPDNGVITTSGALFISGGTVNITNSDDEIAMYAVGIEIEDGADVTVNGTILSDNNNLAIMGANAKVNGNLVFDSFLISDGAKVEIIGNIDSVGEIQIYDAEVKITGNIDISSGIMVLDSSLSLMGNLDAERGGIAVACLNANADVFVDGNISVANSGVDTAMGLFVGEGFEIPSSYSTTVVVTGTISVVCSDPDGSGAGIIAGQQAKVTVEGSVLVEGFESFGVLSAAGAEVLIGGNVIVTGANGIGALAGNPYNSPASFITVDGTITAEYYVGLGSADAFSLWAVLTAADNKPTSTLAGYKEYTDGINFVWVKDTSTNPGDKPGTGTPATGDTTGLAALAIILALAALGTIGIALSRRKRLHTT